MHSQQFYDPVRQQWVAATPEEHIRQKWIEVMLGHLSFPKELICVEKQLHLLPHLSLSSDVPDRRIDILAYQKRENELVPLLLIECKSISLTEKALLQVMGYNHFIQAQFVAIANEKEIRLGFYQKGEKKLSVLHFLPAYPLLVKATS